VPVIGSLLEPVRLPHRALESLDLLAEAARRLVRLEDAVLGHLESLDQQAQRLGELVARLDGNVAALDSAIPRLEREVALTRRTVDGLTAEVKDLAEHLPDPDGPGPLARARKAIAGEE
jgi:exonuclease VII small subunit